MENRRKKFPKSLLEKLKKVENGYLRKKRTVELKLLLKLLVCKNGENLYLIHKR